MKKKRRNIFSYVILSVWSTYCVDFRLLLIS